MKKIYIYVIITLMACTQYACKGFLDTLPTDKVSSPTAMLTLYDATNAANGMYVDMKWNDYYGSNMLLMGEYRGGDLLPRSLDLTGFAFMTIYLMDYGPEQNTYFSLWDRCYNIIARANGILDSWEKIPASTDAEKLTKNNIKGQALAVRALCYFDLNRLYGYPYLKDNGASLGVPIVTKSISPAEATIKRSSVKQVYERVLQDIDDALPLLTKSKTTGKMNYWAAKLLQARVYLYMGQWDNALTASKEVINASPYELVSADKYLAYWGEQGGAETIFELLVTKVSNIDNNGGASSYYFSMSHLKSAGGTIVPNKDWVTMMEDDKNDVRYKMLRTDSEMDKSKSWLYKFIGTSNGTDLQDYKINNPRILRLSEAYLIAAEAALKATTKDQLYANTVLNTLRKKRNQDAIDITASEELILLERRKEFIGEGHLFFDLMRLGKTIARTGGYHFAENAGAPINVNWNNHKCVLPISSANRLIYPECEQNPVY